MAHKKGASSSRNGRDSNAQRLGVKRFGGQQVSARVGHARRRREFGLPLSSRHEFSLCFRDMLGDPHPAFVIIVEPLQARHFINEKE